MQQDGETKKRKGGKILAVAVLQEVVMSAVNVAVFVCCAAADFPDLLDRLARHGLGEGVSVIAMDRETTAASVAYYIESGQIQRAPLSGNFLSFANLLNGWTLLLIPDKPAVVIAGPLARCLSRTLQNEALFGDMGTIAGALYSLGITRDAACEYEAAALKGDALLVIHGRSRDVARARALLVHGE